MSNNNSRICEFCTYSWISRVNAPKSCPRCKRRFDYKEAKAVLESLSRQFNYDLITGIDWSNKNG